MKKRVISLLSVVLIGLAANARAVDYALPDIDGQIQSLDQYKGKWLVVNYWATWCGTCVKELPDLIALHKDNTHGDIAVVGINYESVDDGRLKAFVAEHAIPYRILRTNPVANTPLGPVSALPTTYIVDPDGKVIAAEIGIVTQKNLEAYIRIKKASGSYTETVQQKRDADNS